jgi:hypothetical protein
MNMIPTRIEPSKIPEIALAESNKGPDVDVAVGDGVEADDGLD